MDVVLVADDDPECREMLADVLGRRGYEVVAVPDGRAALEALAVMSAGLLLLDLAMPEMDGLTALRELRADRRWKDLPVVLLSGAISGDDARSARRLGVRDCLHKGRLTLDALFDAVSSHCRPVSA